VDTGQVAVPLRDVEAVADDEAGRDAESDIPKVEIHLLEAFLDEERAHLERPRPACREVLAQVRERETRVDETAMKSNSTGRSIARERSLMKTNAPLSTPTSNGGRPA
jgi:hypothetical protein